MFVLYSMPNRGLSWCVAAVWIAHLSLSWGTRVFLPPGPSTPDCYWGSVRVDHIHIRGAPVRVVNLRIGEIKNMSKSEQGIDFPCSNYSNWNMVPMVWIIWSPQYVQIIQTIGTIPSKTVLMESGLLRQRPFLFLHTCCGCGTGLLDRPGDRFTL